MIEILLSTYNGELFLRQQLDSIIDQTYQEWEILIRDDGSCDNTISIINEYCERYPHKIRYIGDNKNIGCLLSYETLLQESKAPYILFCDQDDVWMPDKIESTLNKMIFVEKSYPGSSVLIHTDLEVVDQNKNAIHSSFWKLSHIKPNLLKKFNYLGVYNGVTGCSMMINKAAKINAMPFSANARMHDSWISLCVSKVGYIDYVENKTILYRQHEYNQIGVEEQLNSYNFKNKFLNFKKVIIKNRLQLRMLNDLHYGNILKYLVYKLLYFMRSRI